MGKLSPNLTIVLQRNDTSNAPPDETTMRDGKKKNRLTENSARAYTHTPISTRIAHECTVKLD